MTQSKSTAVKPDSLAPFSEKITNEYGLKIAEFISQEWFNGAIIANGCEFIGRRNWIHNKRLYHRAEQDTEAYKKILARTQNDLSYMNIDWRPINVIAKFNNIVSNGLSEENYRMDIRATDRLSVQDKKTKILEHKKNMKALPMLAKAKEVYGIDVMPQGFVPEDDDELAFYSEIKDRPKIEIAEEITINFIKEINDWKNIKEQCDKDIVQCGIMGSRVYVDPINGVSIQYIDPENLVHSYVKKNDFSDAFYFGWVDTITISDLKRESNFSDSELREIAKTYSSSINAFMTIDYMACPFDNLVDIKVDILRFTWKTSKEIVYKKQIRNGEIVKMSRREDKWNGEKSKASKVYDTWLEGNYIVGARKVYGYKECENISKDELNNAKSPFIVRASNIYKNRLNSFQSDIEPLCDQMQYAHLKIQHLLAELKPDLVKIDIDSLAEIDSDTKGTSKNDSWKNAIAMMQVKGVILTQRIDMGEEGIKDTETASPMPMPQGSALTIAMNTWAYYYNQLREVTGINPARDGSLPADALLGVNQMAQLASNTVTKHIVNASIDFDKRVCQTISSRVKTIFRYNEGKDIQEFYKRAVGKENIDAMETMANRSLHDFGFTINMIPSTEEINEFKEDLAIAMKEGTIDVEDKIEAQALAKTNIKLANEYLKYIRKKRIKQKQEETQQNTQAQTESNIASNQSAEQAKTQSYATKKTIDLDYEKKLSTIRIMEKKALQDIEAPVKEKEFQQEVYITELENNVQLDAKKYLEDRKDQRIAKQGSQNSEMIHQRKENSVPIDFEDKYSLDD